MWAGWEGGKGFMGYKLDHISLYDSTLFWFINHADGFFFSRKLKLKDEIKLKSDLATLHQELLSCSAILLDSDAPIHSQGSF